MIAIVDYGVGNLGSILNMFRKIGIEAVVTADPSGIEKAEKLILPGVGAFDTAMKNIRDLKLLDVLNQKVIADKTPVIGLCLGMQILTESSEEGKMPGLGWIKGKTIRFRFEESRKDLKIPHMGWNTVEIKNPNPLVEGLDKNSRFYFVHSYHMDCKDKEDVTAVTNYGYDFPSVVKKENIYGIQFHPEKSHKFGMRLLENFANRC
jgi:glutamine amidotransferase